jgi:hypothetical protein
MDTAALYLLAGVVALVATAAATWRFSRAFSHRGPAWAATQRLAAAATAATKSLSRVHESKAIRQAILKRAMRVRDDARQIGVATGRAVTGRSIAGRGQAVPRQLPQPPQLQQAPHAQPLQVQQPLHAQPQAVPPANPAAAARTAASPAPAGAAPVAPAAAVRRPQPAAATPRPADASPRRPPIETRTSDALADDFMLWLREAVASGAMAMNTAQAPVHMSADGLVLVYPAAFQAYVKTCAELATGRGSAQQQVPKDKEKIVLKAVCEPGWHLPGLLNSNLLHFQLLQRPGTAPAFLRGLVLRTPQRFVQPLPPPNPALTRLF